MPNAHVAGGNPQFLGRGIITARYLGWICLFLFAQSLDYGRPEELVFFFCIIPPMGVWNSFFLWAVSEKGCPVSLGVLNTKVWHTERKKRKRKVVSGVGAVNRDIARQTREGGWGG